MLIFLAGFVSGAIVAVCVTALLRAAGRGEEQDPYADLGDRPPHAENCACRACTGEPQDAVGRGKERDEARIDFSGGDPDWVEFRGNGLILRYARSELRRLHDEGFPIDQVPEIVLPLAAGRGEEESRG